MKNTWISIILLACVSLALPARNAEAGDGYVTELSEINCGSMVYYLSDLQKYKKAPELAMKAHLAIDGLIATISLTQTFSNPSDRWLAGTYVFPLPETAAVSRFRLTVANRMIEGEIKEKQEAKAIYEEAMAEGKKAALLEQDRPNIFTTSVANIPPRETIIVELEYRQVLEPEDGEYLLRFPLVITPRYDPDLKERSVLLTDAVAIPDDHIPVTFNLLPLLGGGSGKRNPVDVSVELNAGFPVASITSLYHEASVVMKSPDELFVTLAGGPVPADRDFVLAWRPEVESRPETALFFEQGKTASYFLLMIQPPVSGAGDFRPIPRETIYIIDTSGSMEGSSLRQAREALLAALRLMSDTDLFNIIAFNNNYKCLYDECKLMTVDHYQEAVRFVSGLKANGGTEMKPALTRALSLPRDRSLLGQVVFMTDGAVSNESELFALIRQKLDDRRFFAVGIGSAPNSYFMRKAALAGKGTFTYVGSVAEVEPAMNRLFRMIRHPVMRNIEVVFDGAVSEIWPERLPDLYAGQPVMILARLAEPSGRLVVRGDYAGRLWSKDISLEQAGKAEGVGTLWARKKIETLLDQSVEGISEDAIRPQVLPIALEFSLLSPYTSFVAVEQVISKPASEKSDAGNVPLNPPAGWQPPENMIRLAGTATGAKVYILFGCLLLVLSLAALGAIRLRSG